MKKYNIYFAIFLIVVMGVLIIQTIAHYPHRARNFPLIVACLTVCLLIIQIIKECRNEKKLSNGTKLETKKNSDAKGNYSKFFRTVMWAVGLVLMIWLFGLIAALPLFTLTYIKTHGENWKWAIGLGVSMLGVVYVGFGILLKIQLYEGLIFQSIKM